MANPTTNYGFVLPTSSDLVTDLPADFDVALQGVDTRLKALQPGTTLGDLAYSSATANTNTRLAVGSTGQVLTVAGGVPTWAAPSAGGTWTTWSPTYTGLTIGNGTVVARYTQTGKTVTLFWRLTFGSTTAVTAVAPSVSLPANAAYSNIANVGGFLLNAGVEAFVPLGQIASSTDFILRVARTDQTYLIDNNISSTVPFTWGTSDEMTYTFTYEAA